MHYAVYHVLGFKQEMKKEQRRNQECQNLKQKNAAMHILYASHRNAYIEKIINWLYLLYMSGF